MIATLEGVVQLASAWLELFGLPVLFVIFVLKGSLVGKVLPTSVFLPGYVLVIDASYAYAAVVVVLVTVGHVVGQVIVYGGCRRYGTSFLGRIPTLEVDPDADRLRRFTSWFEAYGGLAIFATNAVPWTRGLIAIPAGVASYPAGRYTLYVTGSTLLYHAAYVGVALAGLALVA